MAVRSNELWKGGAVLLYVVIVNSGYFLRLSPLMDLKHRNSVMGLTRVFKL